MVAGSASKLKAQTMNIANIMYPKNIEILTFLVRQDSNQMQVEEGGREESDVKCLARR